MKRHSAYDVDLLASLQSLLKCDQIAEQVMAGHFSSDGSLCDFCDGSLFKQKDFFKHTPMFYKIFIL
jgi:hypothetical protein